MTEILLPIFTERSKPTDSNAESHFVCTIHVNSSVMQFVDLAGNECAPNREDSLNSSESLVALWEVLAAVQNENTEIPYGNSVLTQILQPTINRSSFTTLILNCESSIQETLCTPSLENILKPVGFSLKQSLLHKERSEKQSLLREIEKLERTVQRYKTAVKDKDSFIVGIHKKEKSLFETIDKLRKEVASSRIQTESASKKLHTLLTLAQTPQEDPVKRVKTTSAKHLSLFTSQEAIDHALCSLPFSSSLLHI